MIIRAPFCLILLISTAVYGQETSTWQTIQQQILNRQCVSCHTEGMYFARQSGLVLTSDVAYNQLVNAVPTNAAAKSEGLLRLGTKGLRVCTKVIFGKKSMRPIRNIFIAIIRSTAR